MMSEMKSKLQKITVLVALVLFSVNAGNIYAATTELVKDIGAIEEKSNQRMASYQQEAMSYGASRHNMPKSKYKNEAKKIAKDSEGMVEQYKQESNELKVKSFKAASDYVRQNKDVFGAQESSCGGGGMEEEASKEKKLVFLTLAMNKKNLEQIIREAKVYGFKPVIRGFKDGSYIATVKELSDIIEKTGYGVEVDPESFEEFDVKLVPTFVVATSVSTEGNDKRVKYNKVAGNISFDHVLRLFATRGGIIEDGQK